ncbi:ubiquinone biosynthesis monooxygenase COQ6 [Batrachochytrium salamandrivorans]|nr:ubiquinone biosynthesis monooxygenase COQ6 [Batrachochytrium salamandrivorans]
MVGSVLSLARLSSASWKQKWPLISTTSSQHAARSGLSHCTTALSGSGGTCNPLVFMHTFSCNRSVHVSATHNFSSSSSSSGSLPDPSPIDHFDICIVGGSIIGTAAACAIAHSPYTSGKRIALVEAGNIFGVPTLTQGQFANRVSSITPGSARFLNEIGVWAAIPDKHDYSKMCVWDSSSDGMMHFEANEAHLTLPDSSPAIGWIVQNHQIQAALAELTQRTPAITLFNSSAVTSISNDNPSCFPSVALNSGDRFSCQLLIGADGGNSKVREFAGIQSIGWDYDGHGLVATLEIQNDSNCNDTAWQRFLPTGPIAILPLSSTKSSMVWSTTPAIAAKLLKLSDEDFVELVNAALHNPVLDVEFALNQILPDGSVSSEVDLKSEIEWGRLRGAAVGSGQGRPHRVVRVQPKSRAAFPLRLRNSTAYTGRRVALIGDAAHTIHPLAGQGLNLGLADAQALSKAIVDAAKHGGDLGSDVVCDVYARERFAKSLSMLGAVDGVSRVFGGMLPSSLRGMGMNAINSSDLLKKAFMAMASA